jgi:hypothetical protein
MNGGVMNKQHLLLKLLCCAYFALLIGCGPSRIVMAVDSYGNPDLNIAEYKRFSFLPLNSEKPLMEKQLFSFIKIEMEKKGYIYDDKMPQFLIAVQLGVSSQEKQAGVHSRPVQVYQPPPVGKGVYGTWQTQHVTEGGGSYTVNNRWMKFDFIDVIKKKPGDKIDKITYLWQGEVNSQGSSELSEVVKCLISGLLRDYPAKLTSSKITLKLDECK